MCAMSMVMQNHLDKYDSNPNWKFDRLIAEYLEAKAEDALDGKVNCEHEDKVARIQQITGLNLKSF